MQTPDAPLPDRFCDVVMKGGVTSGVVYPSAIVELAKAYCLKNIGGTSVGAIAASLAAAAEYDRRGGSVAGYGVLAGLPKVLAADGALLRLFRPDPRASAVFDIALCWVGSKPMRSKVLATVLKALRHWYPVPIAALLLSLALVVMGGARIPTKIDNPLEQIVLPLLAVAAIFVALTFVGWLTAFVFTNIVILDDNDFGWCHGHDAGDAKALAARLKQNPDVLTLTPTQMPRLTDWLEALVEQAAGRTLQLPPLTFGDLWTAKTPDWYVPAQGERAIDFRLVTTCITLGRPFEMPFDPQEKVGTNVIPPAGVAAPSPFFFAENEMAKFFSNRLVEHLVAKSPGTKIVDGVTYHRWPAPGDVPLVVAARFSMSFPILFSALKLYAFTMPESQLRAHLESTDSAPAEPNEGVLQPVWFSDGGLSSNFPLHLFDSSLPRWPTFAVDLLGGPAQKKNGTAVVNTPASSYPPFIEGDKDLGSISLWNKMHKGPRGNVVSFLLAIVDTMRTWNDTKVATLQPNAQRTIGIRLSEDEGGLNLNMPPQVITELTDLGTSAGALLVNEFGSAPDTGRWKAHRWTRYRASLSAVTRWRASTRIGYANLRKSETPYDALVRGCIDGANGVPYATIPAGAQPLPEPWATAQIGAAQDLASQEFAGISGLAIPPAIAAAAEAQFISGEGLPSSYPTIVHRSE